MSTDSETGRHKPLMDSASCRGGGERAALESFSSLCGASQSQAEQRDSERESARLSVRVGKRFRLSQPDPDEPDDPLLEPMLNLL